MLLFPGSDGNEEQEQPVNEGVGAGERLMEPMPSDDMRSTPSDASPDFNIRLSAEANKIKVKNTFVHLDNAEDESDSQPDFVRRSISGPVDLSMPTEPAKIPLVFKLGARAEQTDTGSGAPGTNGTAGAAGDGPEPAGSVVGRPRGGIAGSQERPDASTVAAAPGSRAPGTGSRSGVALNGRALGMPRLEEDAAEEREAADQTPTPVAGGFVVKHTFLHFRDQEEDDQPVSRKTKSNQETRSSTGFKDPAFVNPSMRLQPDTSGTWASNGEEGGDAPLTTVETPGYLMQLSSHKVADQASEGAGSSRQQAAATSTDAGQRPLEPLQEQEEHCDREVVQQGPPLAQEFSTSTQQDLKQQHMHQEEEQRELQPRVQQELEQPTEQEPQQQRQHALLQLPLQPPPQPQQQLPVPRPQARGMPALAPSAAPAVPVGPMKRQDLGDQPGRVDSSDSVTSLGLNEGLMSPIDRWLGMPRRETPAALASVRRPVASNGDAAGGAASAAPTPPSSMSCLWPGTFAVTPQGPSARGVGPVAPVPLQMVPPPAMQQQPIARPPGIISAEAGRAAPTLQLPTPISRGYHPLIGLGGGRGLVPPQMADPTDLIPQSPLASWLGVPSQHQDGQFPFYGAQEPQERAPVVEADAAAGGAAASTLPSSGNVATASDELPSVGSAGHAAGTCRPCAHNWKPGRCSNGKDCTFCHICDEAAFKRCKKDKISRLRDEGVPRRRSDKSGNKAAEANAPSEPIGTKAGAGAVAPSADTRRRSPLRVDLPVHGDEHGTQASGPGELTVSNDGSHSSIRWLVDLKAVKGASRCHPSRKFMLKLDGKKVPFMLMLNPREQPARDGAKGANTAHKLKAAVQMKCLDAAGSSEGSKLRVSFAVGKQPPRLASAKHDFKELPICNLPDSDCVWDLSSAAEPNQQRCTVWAKVWPAEDV